MTRKGIAIRNYPLKAGVDPQISYSTELEGRDACVASGLDLYKWWRDEYSVEFMIFVVASYNMSNLVEAHTEDAARIAAEKGK